jgi:beta-lactamase class A
VVVKHLAVTNYCFLTSENTFFAFRGYPAMSTVFSSLSQLDAQHVAYACYFRQAGQVAQFSASAERFASASLIKVPIALAWVHLERLGQVDRRELCDLDGEPQVEGAGFSWLLRHRRPPYQDVLLMMLSLSDNLCTNALIARAGMERLNRVFQDGLGLKSTQLQRKMMDVDARTAGRENWIGAADAVRLYQLIRELAPEERAWLEPMLLANQDTSLLLRDVPRDSLAFYHKTGSLPGVLNDWGYTRERELFLLTNGVEDEDGVNRVFGEMGRMLV